MLLTEEFYRLVIEKLSSHGNLGLETEAFIYDPKFTPDWLIEHLKEQKLQGNDDEMWRDGGHCYQFILDEIEASYHHGDDFWEICTSEDIGEHYLAGEYNYYSGFINRELPFLWHQSADGIQFPSWLTIYGPQITIEIRNDKKAIDIFETVPRVRAMFLDSNEKTHKEAIKEYLANTDRRIVE